MMNCEMKLLCKQPNLLNFLELEIDKFLSSNKGRAFTSYEIYNVLPSSLQNGLILIAKGYSPRSAMSVPAAYVGSCAAYMAQKVSYGIQHTQKNCSILHRVEDAFLCEEE